MNPVEKGIYILIIASIFILVIKQSIKTIYKDNYENMSETTILTYEYLLGIAGFLVGKYIFGSKYFKNTTMKYGLIIGGLILIFMTFILNWEKMDDKTKLISIVLFLLIIMYKTYMSSD